MAFRVKNLMIQVLPGEGEQPKLDIQPNCRGGSITDGIISFLCRASCQNSFILPTPFQNSLICDPKNIPLPDDPDQLGVLKAQLQDALKAVEEQEKAINEQTNIKTVEQAQILETNLEEALEEVRRQKLALQQQSEGKQE
jgi:hypothetical protein